MQVTEGASLNVSSDNTGHKDISDSSRCAVFMTATGDARVYYEVFSQERVIEILRPATFFETWRPL